MIKSMTGFGRGESTDGIHNFNIEIKTVNHRYNDMVLKIPKHLSYLEEKIKRRIKNRISRGRVEVYINLEYISESAMEVKVDIPLAKAYKSGLELILEELNLKDEIKLSHIMSLSEIIKTERKELDEDITWDCLKTALDKALEKVIDMREKEGVILKRDMEYQVEKIKKMVKEIEKRSPLVVEEYKEKLKERIRELLDDEYNLDEERLNNEIAFFADKSDINEEIVRLNSHINQFLQTLESGESIGRKLDFIIQEMNREINTIGSKASDLVIGNYVIDVKSELEKMREQAQNVE
ncbi:YicC/YloC family endoribonuclease [Clostridium sp. Cult1]|uniref:YicC/YloC family endoribonuclease n=1 Tax=Clostridium sp. Cult1 TaxID=2079002 RepID=UPI001F44417D|nr:YicC/YloC family endoribonuclease [Clostridium sp. Cult1]MCF6462708.1 YicC family protein [Clostridium sp. Cult1]